MATGKDLTEVSTFTAAIHVPKTNEPVSAATLEVPFQAVANRTQALKDSIINTDAVNAAQQATIDTLRDDVGIKAFAFVSADPSSAGQWDSTFNNGTWTQIAIGATNRALTCQIDLPTGTEITRIDVWITGGAHGSTPAVMPAWYLYQVGNAGGTLLTSKSDTSLIGTYVNPHAISKTGLSITIDNASYVYTLQCYGEAAASSAPNVLQVFLAEVYFTPIS